MPGILKVNCLVLGDPEGEIFTIKVAATENISALKDLIKIKRNDLFRDVVAAKITVGTAFKQYTEIKDTVHCPGSAKFFLISIVSGARDCLSLAYVS